MVAFRPDEGEPLPSFGAVLLWVTLIFAVLVAVYVAIAH